MKTIDGTMNALFSEADLVEIMKENPRKAWDVLYRQKRALVLTRILRSLPTWVDHEDALQRFFLKCVPDIIRCFDPSKGFLDHYFNRVLSRFISLERKTIRASKEVSMYTDRGDPIEIMFIDTDERNNVERLAKGKEEARILSDCIESLPRTYRTAMMFYIEHMDQITEAEMADELGISSGSFRQQIYRARKMLRTCFKRKSFPKVRS